MLNQLVIQAAVISTLFSKDCWEQSLSGYPVRLQAEYSTLQEANKDKRVIRISSDRLQRKQKKHHLNCFNGNWNAKGFNTHILLQTVELNHFL